MESGFLYNGLEWRQDDILQVEANHRCLLHHIPSRDVGLRIRHHERSRLLMNKVYDEAYQYAIKAGCTHEDATFYAQAYMVKSPTGTANHDDTFPDWTIRRSH